MPPYELIVIGASSGGLGALERLLVALPEGFRTPIALAQHRSVDSRSEALAEMLGRHAGVDACDVEDKQPLEPGKLYVAPPDYHLLVEHGSFALSVDEAVQYSRPSIDVLFDSAADVYGDRLIGVVLTGANADGAYGLGRVKRRGGATIVEDPATAERPEMPEAAIATGAADHVLPLDAIAPKLVELVAA
jgi:two-component system chemotaxis response regulator CheB